MITYHRSSFIGHDADRVSAAICRLGQNEWAGIMRDIQVESGAPLDPAAGIWSFSGVDRCCTYANGKAAPHQSVRAILRVIPITDMIPAARVIPCVNRRCALVEYSADVDGPAEDRVRWRSILSESFAALLESVRAYLADDGPSARHSPPPCSLVPQERAEPEPDARSGATVVSSLVAAELPPRHAVPASSAAERDLERLWKTIQDAARGG